MGKLGFEYPGSDRNAEQPETPQQQLQLPASLLDLRKKIGQLTVFMSTTEFSRMPKQMRLETVVNYNQLVVTECEFSAAVGTPAAQLVVIPAQYVEDGDDAQ